MAASVEYLLEVLDRDREVASSSEGITEDVRSSSCCTSDIESSPLVCSNLSGLFEDWEAPPLLDMQPKDLTRRNTSSFFTIDNISTSLMSPKREVRQPSSSTDSMGSPPELVPVPNTPPLVPVARPAVAPQAVPMSNVMPIQAPMLNQFAARRVPSFRNTRPLPMNTPACTPQQLAELESDELRRQMVAAQQVQLHAARSQLACMVAQQAPMQEGVLGQSMVAKQEFDMNKVDPELYKVKMCRNMNKHGVCPYASQCVFAHSPNELRSRETNLDVLKRLYDACKPTVNPLKYKVNSCQKFEELGFCPYEPHCVFAHGPAELRSVANNLQAIHRIQHICQTTGISFVPSS
eukprot:TRINITY_DN46537_c0_g1_i1.p1 TRINITY_DN46537_c0_g1~~TRINITY_DN46537_c0_g1_i1.p1  ORF type:complete len:372 (+),score=100.00 TRINITY_DN46537_c0_g1_i1:70-1116(+)